VFNDRLCWQITKLDLLKHFETTSDQVQSALEQHVDEFVERIHSRLTDPLRQRIQQIRRELQASFCNNDNNNNKQHTTITTITADDDDDDDL